MRKRNEFLVTILMLSLVGCGQKEAEIATVEPQVVAEEQAVETETVIEAEATENVNETEEPTYTERGDLYVLDSGCNDGGGVDMTSWGADYSVYELTKGINFYYTDTSIAGYTKDNAKIHVSKSNGEWNFCIFDKKGYLIRTEDLADAVQIKDKKGKAVSDTSVNVAAKASDNTTSSEKPDVVALQEASPSGPTAEQPVEAPSAEAPVEEAPAVAESDKYTPEEAVAVYRSIMESGGLIWNPSLKDGGSWGTGWLYLDKGQPEWAAESNLESAAMGNGDGIPWTYYYLEVTGSDDDAVYITEWSD